MWIQSFYSAKNNAFSFRINKYFNYIAIENTTKIIVAICLFVNVIFGMSSIKKEYSLNFSGAKETANFINKQNLQANEIACYRSWRATALAPYLPNTKLWAIDRKEYSTFFILDSVFTKYGNSLSEKEILKRTKEKYKSKALLLLNEPLSIPSDDSYDSKLLYNNEKLIWGCDDENFFLYEIQFK